MNKLNNFVGGNYQVGASSRPAAGKDLLGNYQGADSSAGEDNTTQSCSAVAGRSAAEPEFISNTIRNLFGYRLRKIVHRTYGKRKVKLHERWFMLPEGEGAKLPRYVREGAHMTGYKSYNSLFAAVAYFKMPANSIERIII